MVQLGRNSRIIKVRDIKKIFSPNILIVYLNRSFQWIISQIVSEIKQLLYCLKMNYYDDKYKGLG